MKNIALFVTVCLATHCCFSQWTTSGNNIYNSNTGNVGVGTATPAFKLNVKVAAQNDGILLNGTGTTSVGLINNTTHSGWNALSREGDNLLLWKGSSPDASDEGGLIIGPWSNSYTGLRITPDGNVGIGTHTPGPYKLAVEGWLGARKIKITQASPWADYVFYEDYRLRTLEDVEQFIKMHRHLPEVPSAAEVEKDGLDIGDNQALLLQKIEELTLYIIEQQKQVKEQQKQINELKNLVTQVLSLNK